MDWQIIDRQRRTRHFYGGSFRAVEEILTGEKPLHPVHLLDLATFLQALFLEYDVCFVCDKDYRRKEAASSESVWRIFTACNAKTYSVPADVLPGLMLSGKVERLLARNLGLSIEEYNRADIKSKVLDMRRKCQKARTDNFHNLLLYVWRPEFEFARKYGAAQMEAVLSDQLSQRGAILATASLYFCVQTIREKYSIPDRMYRAMKAEFRNQIDQIVSVSEARRFYVPPLVAIVLDRCGGNRGRLVDVILEMYDEYQDFRNRMYEAEAKMATAENLKAQIDAVQQCDAAIERMQQKIRHGKPTYSTIKRFWHYFSEGAAIPKRILNDLVKGDNEQIVLSPVNEFIRMYGQVASFKDHNHWRLLEHTFRHIDIKAFEGFAKVSGQIDQMFYSPKS